MQVDIIVTRHKSLVTLLQEKGLDISKAKIIEHAEPEVIKDKIVAGILPLHLACMCKKLVYVPLYIPKHKRGEELTLEELRQYSGDIKIYEVKECSI